MSNAGGLAAVGLVVSPELDPVLQAWPHPHLTFLLRGAGRGVQGVPGVPIVFSQMQLVLVLFKGGDSDAVRNIWKLLVKNELVGLTIIIKDLLVME